MPEFAIGIDIGGGSTKIGLVSSEGSLLDRQRVLIGEDDTAEEIIGHYARAITLLIEAHPEARPMGIGIGFPGRISDDNMSSDLGNVPALENIPLAEQLGSRFALPARMQNDATAAGLAEALFGRDKAAQRVLVITVGTGIGLAFAVNGKPFVTSGGGLGDAGHLIINTHNPERCRLGCLGCLESVASGDALDRQIHRFAEAHPDHAFGKIASAADLIHCARQGDKEARDMLADTGRWIGRAAATWAHLFAPDVILIGGGLSAAGDLLLQPIEQEARRCGLEMYLKNVRFALASLGNDAGMIGAAAQMFLDPA